MWEEEDALYRWTWNWVRSGGCLGGKMKHPRVRGPNLDFGKPNLTTRVHHRSLHCPQYPQSLSYDSSHHE